MSLPELQQNPLVQRVIGQSVQYHISQIIEHICLEIFDDDGNGEVDFKEFIQVMFIRR